MRSLLLQLLTWKTIYFKIYPVQGAESSYSHLEDYQTAESLQELRPCFSRWIEWHLSAGICAVAFYQDEKACEGNSMP